MYIGTLDQSARSESLHPSLKTLFDYVRTHDFNKMPLGKIEVDGSNLYIMNLDIEGGKKEERPLEMHRKYIDVHILLAGREEIGWKPIEKINELSQEYDEEGDCALSNERAQFYVGMLPGDFCIVFPEDPHAPAISEGKIRKLIGKILL